VQVALNQSETETRTLRKHLLTVMHHVQSSVRGTSLASSLAVACNPTEVSKEILCDTSNTGKGLKHRDWVSDVTEMERIIDALTTHLQQKEREISGANLKIHLLEQSARILQPSVGLFSPLRSRPT
jgi:hypothetical protein